MGERGRMQTLSSVSLETLDYFPGWFSGFVEAEGCFSLRRKSTGFVSFSIGQRHDDYLLWAIHRFLGAQNKVRYLPSTNKQEDEDSCVLFTKNKI